MQPGVFSGMTQRVEPVFLPSGVIPQGHFLLGAEQKNRLGKRAFFTDNGPS